MVYLVRSLSSCLQKRSRNRLGRLFPETCSFKKSLFVGWTLRWLYNGGVICSCPLKRSRLTCTCAKGCFLSHILTSEGVIQTSEGCILTSEGVILTKQAFFRPYFARMRTRNLKNCRFSSIRPPLLGSLGGFRYTALYIRRLRAVHLDIGARKCTL
jgi:hypothetical protein